MITFIGVMLLGIALSVVIASVYVWARFLVPARYAPLIVLTCIVVWAWIVGNGVLQFLQ